MTYRELQTALKNLRNAGYAVQVKLNASFDTLQAEYNRLTAIASQDSLEQPQPQQVMTTDQFNEWVGLPYKQTSEPVVDITLENTDEATQAIALEQADSTPMLIISQQLEEPTEKVSATSEPIENVGKQPSKQLEALQGKGLYITPEPITATNKQPSNSTQDLQGHSRVKDVGLSAKSSYWIDGTELGQNLNHTPAQALRNLEDGINWLKKLPARLKAFEQGFREGLRDVPIRQQASLKQPHVIPIERSHQLPKTRTIPLAA